MIDNVLAKKAAALFQIVKDPDQSRVDHHWKTSTLESCEDLKITILSSSCWYMTSDLFLLYMLILFDWYHQGVPRILYFGSLV